LANVIFDLTGQREFKRDFTLCDQLRGASGSGMHNIAEGFDAGSDLEFIRFLKTSRRSASEIQSQLYLALDRQYITAIQLEAAYNKKASEIKRPVNGMIAYLRQNRKKSHGNIVAESDRGIIK
jgi:four helix bundle protein